MYLFELRPNASLTHRDAAFFFLSIAAVSLAVAIGFATAGFWPVLPFAGLELAALGVALRASLRHGRTREVIRVDEDSVLLQQTGPGRMTEHRFARPWTRVELQHAENASWPSRLIMQSGGRRIEIGAFLTEDEKSSLRTRLAELLGRPWPHPGFGVAHWE